MKAEEFCTYHGLSKEAITEGVLDCHAHLAEGRVFICRYKSIDEARDKCVDYQLTQQYSLNKTKMKTKMKNKIRSINGLRIGDVFNVEGINYIVTKFPTRYSVCGNNQKPESGEPNNIKTSLFHTPTLFWRHCKTGVFLPK